MQKFLVAKLWNLFFSTKSQKDVVNWDLGDMGVVSLVASCSSKFE